MSLRAFDLGTRILALSAALSALAAHAAGAQDMLPPPGFGQSQEQDPYAALRLKQCRDLGSFAVVDAPGDRSGAIKINPGSPCADLFSLQPAWMPYIQLNVDVGRGTAGGTIGGGPGAIGRTPWPVGGQGPSPFQDKHGTWHERRRPGDPAIGAIGAGPDGSGGLR